MTTTTKLTTTGSFSLSLEQKDSGSLYVGLPQALAPDLKNGTRPSDGLTLKLTNLETGKEEIRPITYVMGSAAKGFHLCSKGTGPFAVGNVSYEVEILRTVQAE